MKKNLSAKRSLGRKAALAMVKMEKEDSVFPPPPLPTPWRGSTSLRYQAIGAGPATVTVMCLSRLFNYTTTTTQAESLLEAVKVRRLHVWIQPYTAVAATGSAVYDAPAPTCRISINESPTSDNCGLRKEVTLVSGSRGAYYSYKFRGMFANWVSLINTYINSTVFFELGYSDCFPIVQLDFSYQFICAPSMSGAAALAVGTVVDTTSANATCHFYLDNYASSGTEGTQVLKPIQLNTMTVNDPSPLLKKSSLVSTPFCDCCRPGADKSAQVNDDGQSGAAVKTTKGVCSCESVASKCCSSSSSSSGGFSRG